MFLSVTVIKRPVTTILFTAGILVFGYIPFQNMGVDLYPEIEFPTVSIASTLPGAHPEMMDSDVTVTATVGTLLPVVRRSRVPGSKQPPGPPGCCS